MNSQDQKMDSLKKGTFLCFFFFFFGEFHFLVCELARPKIGLLLKTFHFLDFQKSSILFFKDSFFWVLSSTHKTKNYRLEKIKVELFVHLLLLFSTSSFFALLNLHN